MKSLRARFNWRWGVIGIEVLVAVACVLAGWRLVARHPPAPTQVQHGAPAINLPDPFVPIPAASAPATLGGRGPRTSPSGDLLSRLNHDDLDLYRSQWQVIQLLVDGTRKYVEKRVLPALLPG